MIEKVVMPANHDDKLVLKITIKGLTGLLVQRDHESVEDTWLRARRIDAGNTASSSGSGSADVRL